MVLHWRRCGRVGHRRIKFGKEPQSKDWGSFFVYAVLLASVRDIAERAQGGCTLSDMVHARVRLPLS